MNKHRASPASPALGVEGGKHMVEYVMTYQVGITFCNDTPSGEPYSLKHVHHSPKEAAFEYCEMLAEAIEPTAGTAEAPEARHVRLVTFFVVDQYDKVHRHIDSGVFPCEHKPE